MKLLAKYNRINIIVTISVLLISSICFYVMIRHVLVSQLDEDLKLEEQEIVDFVKTNNKLPDQTNYEDQQIEFRRTEDNNNEKKFSSVMVQANADGHKEKNIVQLQHTSTKEFAELNKTVQMMTDKAKQDYESLKNFTDNASHEMQTPLAIINSKLDVLIQDESLSEFQMRQLQGVYDALDRLSNLNQSLLLLTKIENSQFNEQENISLDDLVREKLIQFEELSAAKKLVITTDIQQVNISGNKKLNDILIGNLLNNAIRYNVTGGSIAVKLTDEALLISNSSFLPALDSDQVFQRFYRHADTRQDGNGLGLSIVKQICAMAGYNISYSYFNNLHQFKIAFAIK